MYTFNLFSVYFEEQKGAFSVLDFWFFSIMINEKPFCILHYKKSIGHDIEMKIITRTLTICNCELIHNIKGEKK